MRQSPGGGFCSGRAQNHQVSRASTRWSRLRFPRIALQSAGCSELRNSAFQFCKGIVIADRGLLAAFGPARLGALGFQRGQLLQIAAYLGRQALSLPYGFENLFRSLGFLVQGVGALVAFRELNAFEADHVSIDDFEQSFDHVVYPSWRDVVGGDADPVFDGLARIRRALLGARFHVWAHCDGLLAAGARKRAGSAGFSGAGFVWMHLRGYSGNGDSTLSVQGVEPKIFWGASPTRFCFSIPCTDERTASQFFENQIIPIRNMRGRDENFLGVVKSVFEPLSRSALRQFRPFATV